MVEVTDFASSYLLWATWASHPQFLYHIEAACRMLQILSTSKGTSSGVRLFRSVNCVSCDVCRTQATRIAWEHKFGAHRKERGGGPRRLRHVPSAFPILGVISAMQFALLIASACPVLSALAWRRGDLLTVTHVMVPGLRSSGVWELLCAARGHGQRSSWWRCVSFGVPTPCIGTRRQNLGCERYPNLEYKLSKRSTEWLLCWCRFGTVDAGNQWSRHKIIIYKAAGMLYATRNMWWIQPILSHVFFCLETSRLRCTLDERIASHWVQWASERYLTMAFIT